MPARIELFPAESPQIEAIWRALEQAASPSYFLTWGWVENWLAMLPPEEQPMLAAIVDGGVTGAFFVGRRKLLRHHLIPSRGLFVNATGVPNHDELCIEHNGVLSTGRWNLASLVELLPHDWDELFLPGVDRAALELAVPAGYRVRIDAASTAPYVELARVREVGDYLSLLSSNTRAQIRRARRRVGALEVEVATSLSDALAMYRELGALHTAHWHERGEAGAFADPWFDHFHRRLIERRFGVGEIQLLRVTAKGQTIGIVYNLIAAGRVLFYQSGFAKFDDPIIKPGLLSHAEAIAYCAAAGHDTYDFLAGRGRYKMSLATAASQLLWLRVQRTKLRFAIEDRLRDLKHAAIAQLVRAS